MFLIRLIKSTLSYVYIADSSRLGNFALQFSKIYCALFSSKNMQDNTLKTAFRQVFFLMNLSTGVLPQQARYFLFLLINGPQSIGASSSSNQNPRILLVFRTNFDRCSVMYPVRILKSFIHLAQFILHHLAQSYQVRAENNST